mgnify:FL=1
MNCHHIVYTPFTGVGLHGGMRGQKWLKERIEIFKNYTLKSFLNQSNRKFVHWFSFRPEEASNPLIQELGEYFKKIDYSFIFTFEGLMYHDDKFTSFTVRTVARNLFMMLWDCWRYKQIKNPLEIIKYSFQNKNKTLPHRLDKTLFTLRNILPSAEWVFLTRIDSDDMLHKDAIQLIQDIPPEERRAIVMDKGFILNKQTGQLADWNPTTNPPFHTIIFPYYVFIDPMQHLYYYKEYKSHEDITKIFNCISLPRNKYLYLTHGGNISTYWYTNQYYLVTTGHMNIGTRWNLSKLRIWWLKKKNPILIPQRAIHPFIGREYIGEEKQKILIQFGL